MFFEKSLLLLLNILIFKYYIQVYIFKLGTDRYWAYKILESANRTISGKRKKNDQVRYMQILILFFKYFYIHIYKIIISASNLYICINENVFWKSHLFYIYIFLHTQHIFCMDM